MKVAYCPKNGPPESIRIVEAEIPVPTAHEVLIKVCTSTVTRGDVIMRKIPRPLLRIMGLIFGFKPMEIPGVEVSGIVEEVGEKVTLFRKGDRIFGTATGQKWGGNCQYLCLPEHSKTGVLALKPVSLPFDQAAALPVGAMTALYLMKKHIPSKGDRVLIWGATSSVGTYALQLAVHWGARVTALCSSRNFDLMKTLGASAWYDYKTENPFEKAASGKQTEYDLIFDAVGKLSKQKAKKLLAKEGHFLTVKSPTKENLEDLIEAGRLAEYEKLKVVIDRHYPLDQIAEAHRYVEEGHKRGNVVIDV